LVEFYQCVFGFEPIGSDQKEGITDQIRLCACVPVTAAYCYSSREGATTDSDATGTIHIAFGIARSELPVRESWLAQQGIPIGLRKTWEHGSAHFASATLTAMLWR